MMYAPENSIYLDLGGALAAFGLIFTVYQLRKPQWNLVLQIRARWQRNLFWTLGGIGLLITLVRVFVSEFYIYFSPFPPYMPHLFEIFAYIFFIASPLSLLYLSTQTQKLFNAKTAKRFYELLIWEISKTSDESINSALGVLLPNIEAICKAATGHNQGNETKQYASAILDIVLSDTNVVKVLTTKRLNALQYIFSVIEDYGLTRREAGMGISIIVRNLFYDKNSFFYKHLGREGLALSFNIFESIFNSSIIMRNFDLFGYSTLKYSMRKDLDTLGIEVIIEALSRSIETYLKTGSIPANNINDGLSYLSDIFGDICLTISIEEERGIDTTYSLKDEWESLRHIANFLGHDYPFLAHEEKLNQDITDREKKSLEASFHANTINAGIAGAIYKAFEQLSYLKKTTDTYHIVLDLLEGMLNYSNLKEGYRSPFEKRMWEQIATNVIKRYYPAALRTYLEFFGYCAADNTQRSGWVKEQTERIRNLLYIDLKPLLHKNSEMVNKEKMEDALLPQFISYEKGHFFYIFEFGKGEKKIIPPPQKSSKSALKGVDLEHHSLL